MTDQENSKPITKQILTEKGIELSSCLLNNSYGTVVGVLGGLYFGVKRKSMRPFVAASATGTFGDMIYGYYGNCRELRLNYNATKALYDKMLEDTKDTTIQSEPPIYDNEINPHTYKKDD